MSSLSWCSSAGLWVVGRELRDLLRGGGASPPSSDSPLEARLMRVPPRFFVRLLSRKLCAGGARPPGGAATQLCPRGPSVQGGRVSASRRRRAWDRRREIRAKQDSCATAKTDTNNDCHTADTCLESSFTSHEKPRGGRGLRCCQLDAWGQDGGVLLFFRLSMEGNGGKWMIARIRYCDFESFRDLFIVVFFRGWVILFRMCVILICCVE